jgi:hypothetical protein
MVNFDAHFHTKLRPIDGRGIALKPLDLVVIKKLDWQDKEDDQFPFLRDYEGGYGLVTYFAKEPFYFGNREHPGWVSRDGKSVNVYARKISGDVITSWDFWIPAANLWRIPYNVFIMSVFAEYPIELADDEGPSSHHFLVRGMEQFRVIEQVLKTPYESLVRAHETAFETMISTMP